MDSHILLSSIVHKRFIPFKHNLKYKVPSLYLNIDDLDNINKKHTFFSNLRKKVFQKASITKVVVGDR